MCAKNQARRHPSVPTAKPYGGMNTQVPRPPPSHLAVAIPPSHSPPPPPPLTAAVGVNQGGIERLRHLAIRVIHAV